MRKLASRTHLEHSGVGDITQMADSAMAQTWTACPPFKSARGPHGKKLALATVIRAQPKQTAHFGAGGTTGGVNSGTGRIAVGSPSHTK